MLGLVETGGQGNTATPVNFFLSDAISYRRVTLPSGQYTFSDLASQLQTSLNAATQLNQSSYTVTSSDFDGKITIQNSSVKTFRIHPEMALNKEGFPGFQAPWHASDHCTGFAGPDVFQGNLAKGSLHVNLMRYHSIFINSSLGTHTDSYGPLGQSGIAKRVTIDQPYGSMIHDSRSTGMDYLSLDKQSISSITFRLTDWEGHDIEMDSPWSCSIIIMPEDVTF
jgi:hypothetical protein